MDGRMTDRKSNGREADMDMTSISQHALALYRAHGDSAEAEAARHRKICEARGDTAEAEDWGAIRQAIRQLRGPNAS